MWPQHRLHVKNNKEKIYYNIKQFEALELFIPELFSTQVQHCIIKIII